MQQSAAVMNEYLAMNSDALELWVAEHDLKLAIAVSNACNGVKATAIRSLTYDAPYKKKKKKS